MSSRYTLGLDYGTNSVRALVVVCRNGREVGTAVWNYELGDHGVLLSRIRTWRDSIPANT